MITDLLAPRSVADVGCGTGEWLATFKRLGVERVAGFDGSYIDRSTLGIAENEFFACDLTQPLPTNERFDVAISLEVAEHLPAGVAQAFVEGLTRLSDVVVFSAAIPYQCGAHHVNEQWPTYWDRLFDERGYAFVDAIRYRIWESSVDPWYIQNMMLYVSSSHLSQSSRLREERERVKGFPRNIVHPRMYGTWADPKHRSLKKALKVVSGLPQSAHNSVAPRLRLLRRGPESPEGR